MKFLHTSDLHIGKRIFETSMIEDQKHILKQICEIARSENVQAVVIAGDIYDRAVPSTEGVTLLDDFLTELTGSGIRVILISGNHDSPERVAFADRILEKQGLFLAGNCQGGLKTISLEDDFGLVRFVCMPFVRPAAADASTSGEAAENMITAWKSRYLTHEHKNSRDILVTHFFVTGDQGELPELSDSETTVSVGGIDNVPAGLFRDFCYVALGHIHRSQRVGGGNIFYAGAPLKYSFSEARGDKSVNLVEIDYKGKVKVEARKLIPLHEMRCIRGRLEDLMRKEIVESWDVSNSDFIQATLTDTEELIDPMGTLRTIYPNMLQILLEKNGIPEHQEYESSLKGERKSTAELFADFYEMLKGECLDERRREIVKEAAELEA